MFNGQSSRRHRSSAPYHQQQSTYRSNNNNSFYSNISYASASNSNPVVVVGASNLNPNASSFVPSSIVQLSLNGHPQVFENSSFVSVVGDTLRERLEEQLRNESYECMICCERVRWNLPIWSCASCFHVFHLKCVKKWAKTSSNPENQQPQLTGWRCPGCQHVSPESPNEYFCFCGQAKDPAPCRGYQMPHSCGMLCKKRRNVECGHPCTLPCHPGPCPPCPKIVEKACLCGVTTKKIRCGSEPFQCGKVCEKVLNCETHTCERVCHAGSCELCNEKITLTCFCGKNIKEVSCLFDYTTKPFYACGEVCNRPFSCAVHFCDRKCHEGTCRELCPFDPQVCATCACGKTSLEELKVERKSCIDALPLCDKKCGKPLNCGPEDSKHLCGAVCHSGVCPPCERNTSVTCRCGLTTEEISCARFLEIDGAHPFLCDRRCCKKRSCKQHKCNDVCCVDREHLCMLICGRKLSCGEHTCEMLCHSGKCRPCTNASFDELRCFCGDAVIYPPVQCGTRPPTCGNLCTRDHMCPHPVVHNCHSEPECPPCTYLTQKWCYGNHELRRNIPCYLKDVSCGKTCGKLLACGQHKCTRNCHKEECSNEEAKCVQPCLIPRTECGHPCGSACHVGDECPLTPCLTMVTISCNCGRRTSRISCAEVDAKCKVAKTHLMTVAAKNNEIIAFDTIFERANSVDRLKCLDCDDECARIERNRRLAEALRVQDPDVNAELGSPPYTELLKTQFKANADFIVNLEKTFVELIAGLTASKAKTRSHVFPPMNRDHRKLIHEYAPFFVIETLSYDVEPVRNVVAIASRGRSVAPNVFLSTFMQRETKPVSACRIAAPTNLNTRNARSPGSANMKTLSSGSVIIKRSPPS